MKGGRPPLFMKIKMFLLKIMARIQGFFRKQYTNTKASERIIKAICAGILSTNFYFYVGDLGLPLAVAFICTAIIFYIITSIAYFLLKIVATILKRTKTTNLALFAIGVYAVYQFVDEITIQTGWDTKEEIIFSALFSIFLLILGKSIVSLKNRKILPILTTIFTTIIAIGLIIFIVYPGTSQKDPSAYMKMGEKEIDDEIIYSADYINYEGDSVNLNPYVHYSGQTKWIREKYFNKTLGEIPIKGRLWYPKGAKNVPLVVIAHGNHRFTEESYLGYDYLGKYLARQGIAMASVDMNMLNGFLKFGLKNENDARAYLLLDNLEYLLSESEKTNSKLSGLFNKDQLALMGHSRGGEAASIAASLLDLNYNPNSGASIDYDMKIKAVVSIAPTIDQYNPADQDVKLNGVNFLTIHGTHDTDVEGFSGMKQYNNTHLTDGGFKAAVYIGYANHGNFNSEWGMDTDPPKSWFLNKAELLTKQHQEELASSLIGEFLKFTFFNTGDTDILKNPEDFKVASTPIWSRYQNSSFELLEDFENDYDLTTFPYGKVRFDNIGVSEEAADIGGFDTENTALSLLGSGEYMLSFDKFVQPKKYFTMDIMTNSGEEGYTGSYVEVEMIDVNGNAKTVKLNDFGKLLPKIKIETSKLQKLNEDYEYKNSFKTIRIPMEEFNIDKTQIKYIKIKVKKSSINVLIDNLGYSE